MSTAFILHFCIFFSYAVTIYYDFKYTSVHDPTRTEYGGKWKYLTVWNVCLQALYFGICVLNDILSAGQDQRFEKNKQKKGFLHTLRDKYLASIAFPYACFVSVAFWGLYAIDRELVYPEILDKFIPQWINQQYHTMIIVFMFLELYFVRHEYPTRQHGIFLLMTIFVTYQTWILWIAYRVDYWVYPFLKLLNWPIRVAFFALCWACAIAFYFLGEKLNSKIWGQPTAMTFKKVG